MEILNGIAVRLERKVTMALGPNHGSTSVMRRVENANQDGKSQCK
jgi:hypothetical protein